MLCRKQIIIAETSIDTLHYVNYSILHNIAQLKLVVTNLKR